MALTLLRQAKTPLELALACELGASSNTQRLALIFLSYAQPPLELAQPASLASA